MAAPVIFAPSGDLTIFEIADVKARLQEALKQGPAGVIDLAQVGEVDASALQLLIAVCRSGAVQLANPSARVADLLARVGWTQPKA